VEGDSTTKSNCRGYGWNYRDVILFSVVDKRAVSRENRRELLGDGIKKSASQNPPVHVILYYLE